MLFSPLVNTAYWNDKRHNADLRLDSPNDHILAVCLDAAIPARVILEIKMPSPNRTLVMAILFQRITLAGIAASKQTARI